MTLQFQALEYDQVLAYATRIKFIQNESVIVHYKIDLSFYRSIFLLSPVCFKLKTFKGTHHAKMTMHNGILKTFIRSKMSKIVHSVNFSIT